MIRASHTRILMYMHIYILVILIKYREYNTKAFNALNKNLFFTFLYSPIYSITNIGFVHIQINCDTKYAIIN